MHYEPHDYQKYATEKIIELPACALFMEMGLGKTVSTLTAIDELIYDRFEVEKVLVIAPYRVADDTWTTETEKWDHLKHLRVSKVLGTSGERIAALEADADIYVINRENVTWLVNLTGKEWPFEMIVVDELSSFKSNSAKRFKSLRIVRPLARRFVGLTGTPAPNGLLDLWPQVYLIDRGERLGKTYTGYKDRHFLPDRRNGFVVYSWTPKEGAKEAIEQKLSDICISMKADDYLNLPAQIVNDVYVSMEQRKDSVTSGAAGPHGAWAEHTGRWTYHRMVWIEPQPGAVPAGQCQAASSGADGSGHHTPLDNEGHGGRGCGKEAVGKGRDPGWPYGVP